MGGVRAAVQPIGGKDCFRHTHTHAYTNKRIISLLWTYSETESYGYLSRFSCPCMHASATISRVYIDRFYSFLTKTIHDGIQKHNILFRTDIKDGRLVAILLRKCVHNHFSDMRSLILFKLGINTVHDDIQVHLTLICDLIKDG